MLDLFEIWKVGTKKQTKRADSNIFHFESHQSDWINLNGGL